MTKRNRFLSVKDAVAHLHNVPQELIEQCLDREYKSRPSFASILERLATMIQCLGQEAHGAAATSAAELKMQNEPGTFQNADASASSRQTPHEASGPGQVGESLGVIQQVMPVLRIC